MWFGKKPLSEIWVGATDCHSHILPGVDDGVADMETSLKILTAYEKLQIREVWCTPHVMEDIPNKTEDLKARFAELKAAYQGPIRLNLAAEYMMDGLFLDRMEQDDLLTHGHEGNALLVETSYYTPPMDLHGILKTVKGKGYYPILAHPERYLYMTCAAKLIAPAEAGSGQEECTPIRPSEEPPPHAIHRRPCAGAVVAEFLPFFLSGHAPAIVGSGRIIARLKDGQAITACIFR